MENAGYFDEDDGSSLSLAAGDLQPVIRRQLVGSLVAAVLIATVAAFMALRPVHLEATASAPSRLAAVQQPSFVNAPGSRVAGLVQHRIELP